MTGRRIRRKAMAGWPVLLAVTIRLPVIRLPVATRSSFVRVRGWSADLQSAATNKGHGRPCIRGMRIRVTDILGMLAEGVSHEEILSDFPYLEPDDILAALAYAARHSDHAVLQAA